jgi:ATP-dependent DNA helicase PIF1
MINSNRVFSLKKHVQNFGDNIVKHESINKEETNVSSLLCKNTNTEIKTNTEMSKNTIFIQTPHSRSPEYKTNPTSWSSTTPSDFSITNDLNISISTELSPDQMIAFDKFKNGENLFISGAGGSGKSFIISHMVKYLMLKTNRVFQVTSTTGCSSILLSENLQNTKEYGKMISVKTIHSWSGIRLCKGNENEIIHSILSKKKIVNNWKNIQVLIIDEVSMLSCKILNVLDKIAKQIKKNQAPFGGIQVIFLGDMYQLPPVPDLNDEDTAKFCFESPVWFSIFPIQNHIEFRTIFRQKDETFKKILNEIRIGKLSDEHKEIIKQYVGRTFSSKDGCPVPTKILSTRSKVDFVNNSQYSNIQEEEHIYNITVQTDCKIFVDSDKIIPVENLQAFKNLSKKEIEFEIQQFQNTLPIGQNVLKLKKGCPVMFLVNTYIELSISNGSLGIVVDFSVQNNPIVLFNNGLRMEITKHIWQNCDYPNICILQYPLCLSFANTIHKLQGSTLDMCIMDLGNSIFAEGQIYVALSRVRSLDGLYLLAFHSQKIRVNVKVNKFYSLFIYG